MVLRLHSKILWGLQVFPLMFWRHNASVSSVCKHMKERIACRSCHPRKTFYKTLRLPDSSHEDDLRVKSSPRSFPCGKMSLAVLLITSMK